jgi:Flp pilus assembly CpaE family ATPase
MAGGNTLLDLQVIKDLQANKGSKALASTIVLLSMEPASRGRLLGELKTQGGTQGATIAAFLETLGPSGTRNPNYKTLLAQLPLP